MRGREYLSRALLARSMLTNDKAHQIIRHSPSTSLGLSPSSPLLAESIARGHRRHHDELHLLPLSLLWRHFFSRQHLRFCLGNFYFWGPQTANCAVHCLDNVVCSANCQRRRLPRWYLSCSLPACKSFCPQAIITSETDVAVVLRGGYQHHHLPAVVSTSLPSF